MICLSSNRLEAMTRKTQTHYIARLGLTRARFPLKLTVRMGLTISSVASMCIEVLVNGNPS